jgi:hypothetical protein
MAEVKLVSSFARFVLGDIKGGDAAHAYRKEVMATAIEQAYKGNYSPITEAMTLTEGKAKKARAYAAGFAALGKIGDVDGIIKVQYIGSLNSHENKAAREEIAAKAAASVNAFFAAFDVVMAEKAEKKAKKAESAPVAGAGAGDETTAPVLSADEQRHNAAVALDESVTRMETSLRAGMLTGEQTDRITDALVASLTPEQLHALALVMLDKAGFAVAEPEKLAA